MHLATICVVEANRLDEPGLVPNLKDANIAEQPKLDDVVQDGKEVVLDLDVLRRRVVQRAPHLSLQIL